MTDLPFYTDGAVTIWHRSALALPPSDASVDLIITSPPYFGLREYTDAAGQVYEGQIGLEADPHEFLDALLSATREMIRVLKPSGSIWVNLGDKYNSAASGQNGTGKTGLYGGKAPPGTRPAGRHDRMGGRGSTTDAVPLKSLVGVPWRYALRCIDDLGLILRAEVVWRKVNAVPESARDRVRRTHETWFHFTTRPRYFATEDAPPSDSDRRGSVWDVVAQPLTVPAHLPQHFAAFPLEWPRQIIPRWCPEGGTVLDPFGGTGTVALMAKTLGRCAIHVDLSRDYCRLAQWRVTDPGERAKAMRVDRPEPAPAGLDSLLDLLEDGAA